MKCYYTGALDIGQPCTWATGSPATRDEQSGVSIMLRPGVRQGTATGRIAAPNTSRGRCNRGVRMGILNRTPGGDSEDASAENRPLGVPHVRRRRERWRVHLNEASLCRVQLTRSGGHGLVWFLWLRRWQRRPLLGSARLGCVRGHDGRSGTGHPALVGGTQVVADRDAGSTSTGTCAMRSTMTQLSRRRATAPGSCRVGISPPSACRVFTLGWGGRGSEGAAR